MEYSGQSYPEVRTHFTNDIAAPPLDHGRAVGLLGAGLWGFADLHLGAVDAAVVAIAASLSAPILTWDFRDFRPAAADLGLELLVGEGDLA